jgi:hypothetical protein
MERIGSHYRCWVHVTAKCRKLSPPAGAAGFFVINKFSTGGFTAAVAATNGPGRPARATCAFSALDLRCLGSLEVVNLGPGNAKQQKDYSIILKQISAANPDRGNSIKKEIDEPGEHGKPEGGRRVHMLVIVMGGVSQGIGTQCCRRCGTSGTAYGGASWSCRDVAERIRRGVSQK